MMPEITRKNVDNCHESILRSRLPGIMQRPYIELSDGRKIYIANSQLSSCFTGRNVANVQIVQDTCDHVFIMLKVDKGFSKGDLEDIKNTIPHRFGTYVEFDVLITDDLIKQPSGKTPFIVSKLR